MGYRKTVLKIVGVAFVILLLAAATGWAPSSAEIRCRIFPTELFFHPGLRSPNEEEADAISKVIKLLKNLEDAGAIGTDYRLQLDDVIHRGKLCIDEGLARTSIYGETRATHEPLPERYIALNPDLFKKSLSCDPRFEEDFVNLVWLAATIVHELVHYNQPLVMFLYPKDKEYEAYTREIAFQIRVDNFLDKYQPGRVKGYSLSREQRARVRRLLKEDIRASCAAGERESGRPLSICRAWTLEIWVSPRVWRRGRPAVIGIANNTALPATLKLVEVKDPTGKVEQLHAGEVILGEGAQVEFTYDAQEVGNYWVKVIADHVVVEDEFSRVANMPPRPTFVPHPLRPKVCSSGDRVTIQLDASASRDLDGHITQYKWDFGDGSTYEGPEPIVSHEYGVGKYQITLTVTDNEGLSNTTVGRVVVSVAEEALRLSPGQSIQEAIDRAKEGDVICLSEGTWEENLVIEKSVTLRGAGPEKTVIRSAEEDRPVVLIEGSGIEVVLEGLTITGARGYCPVWPDRCPIGLVARGSAWASLTNSQISDNELCALWVWDSAQVSLTNSIVSSNWHGLIVLGSAQVSLTNSQVSDNGEHGLVVGESAQVTMEESLIEGNYNGIFVAEETHVELADTTIRNNTGWGIAAWLRKCGYDKGNFTGTVLWQGRGNQIYGNGKGDICLPNVCIPEGACD